MEARFAEVRERVTAAARTAGRDPETITLIAVSKNQPLAALQAAYALGQRHFGESRLQEAEPKIARMPADCVWHFIGRLQSNKARKVAEMFDAVHTFDNDPPSAAARSPVAGLIEINIAQEAQKGGVFAENLPTLLEKLVQYENVQFRGLMTVGPALENPEAMQPYFHRMRELQERFGGEWLSMGMSGDFEAAIQEGSTHVRVGTALFGLRDGAGEPSWKS